MKKILIGTLKYTVIIGVMCYLLWYAYQSIDPEQVKMSRWDFLKTVWKESNKWWLVASAIAALLSHLVRAQRWKILLSPLGFRNVGLFNSFTAVINGYFINMVIPRGGEVSRPATLTRLEKVPLDQGLGTVVMERVIDLIFLLLCIGTVFFAQLDLWKTFLEQAMSHDPGAPKEGISTFGIIIICISVMISLGFVYVFFFKKELMNKLAAKAKEFLIGMKTGIMSVFKLEQRGWFLFHSLLIWVCYYIMLYTVLLAFPETANYSPLQALTIFVVGGIAMAIPLPGGTGTYHYLVPLGLTFLCGLEDANKAVAFAFIFHGLQTLVLIVAGGLGLVYIDKKAAQIKKQDAELEQNNI